MEFFSLILRDAKPTKPVTETKNVVQRLPETYKTNESLNLVN